MTIQVGKVAMAIVVMGGLSSVNQVEDVIITSSCVWTAHKGN